MISSTHKIIGVFIIMDLVRFALVPHYVVLVDQLRLMFPHGSQHTEPLSRPNFLRRSFCFFAALLPRQNFSPARSSPSPSPPAAAHLQILRRSFFLLLSHKDGIKKVENTSALAFSLQAIGMIRTQSCYKVSESTCN